MSGPAHTDGGPAIERPASDGGGDRPAADWLTQRERGAILGMRLLLLVATALGRGPARAIVRCVALFYALFDRAARRASRRWLERVHGRPVGFGEVYRHILVFAHVTLDRAFLLMRKSQALVVERTGNHYLKTLARTQTGAMLLGAHLGSFEAMRVGAAAEKFPLNIVGHFENARMINALLERLDPNIAARVLHVGRDPIGFAMRVSERLERGEMVAILADRVGLNDKRVEVDFFGGKAEFPSGPFLLASVVKCPVYLVFGLYFAPNRYSLFCEPFAERIELPRGNRNAALREVVQRYAQRLEEYARKAPDNWFNFHDMWKP
jgi:predicted LPLAT superfamily acyltransferase